MTPPADAVPPVRHPDAPAPGELLGAHYEHCFGCGEAQPHGLHLQARAGEGVSVTAEFTVKPAHQGAPGLAHGGVLATALDETLGSLNWLLRVIAVTGRLETDFVRPVPVDTVLHLEAEVTAVHGRKIYSTADGPDRRPRRARRRPRRRPLHRGQGRPLHRQRPARGDPGSDGRPRPGQARPRLRGEPVIAQPCRRADPPRRTRRCRSRRTRTPATPGADLVTTEAAELAPGERAVLPTGVSIALPDGYAAFVHPRSGLAARCGVALVNAPGTVDAGYRGEIKVIVVNLDPRESVRFERFDRIAQLVVQQVEKVRFHEVAELPGSARAEGGFGSTGGHAAVDGSTGGNGYASVVSDREGQ